MAHEPPPEQPSNTSGPWPDAAVLEAAARAGVEIKLLRPLSVGYQATVMLPEPGLVARVARPEAGPSGLEAELHFVQVAHSNGIPVVLPADVASTQPIQTSCGWVTLWPFLNPTSEGAVDPKWVGTTLRALHKISAPNGFQSAWDPIGRIRARIDHYEKATRPSARDILVLREACDTLDRDLRNLGGSFPIGLIHGDASPGNVVVTRAGPLLIDFDLAGVGPLAWDLTAWVIRVHRFGFAENELRRFLHGYGADLDQQPGFPVLLRLRELLDTSYALEQSLCRRQVVPELRRRMRSWYDHADRSRWYPCRAYTPSDALAFTKEGLT